MTGSSSSLISGGTALLSSSGGSVSSVFGRTGAITAQTGDYTISQISGAGTAAGENLTAVIKDNGSGGLTIGAGQVTAAMLASGVAVPGSPTNSIQTNNGSGGFAGDANFIYNAGLETLTVPALAATIPTNKGTILQNTTVSTTSSRIQNSPPLYWNYHGWNSGTGAADWPISFGVYGTSTTPGFGAPTGTLQFISSLNGGAYTNAFSVDTTGRLTTGTGGIAINGQFLAQGAGAFNGLVNFNSTAGFFGAVTISNTLNVSSTLTAGSTIDFAGDLHAHDNNFYYTYVDQSLSIGFEDISATLSVSSTLANTVPNPISITAALQQVVGAPTSFNILGDPGGTFYTANGSSYTAVVYALDSSMGTIGNASSSASYTDPNDGSKFQLDYGWSAPFSQPNGVSQYLIGLSINGGSFNYRLTGSSSTSFVDNDGSYPLALNGFVQNAGYTSNGSTLGITYNLYNYQVFGSTTVFSSGNINSAVTDPNDGNDYIVNLGISTSIANWKIVRSGNKTGAFNGTSGFYIDQLTDPWSDSSVVTPTSFTKPSARFVGGGGIVSDGYNTSSGAAGATASVGGLVFNEGLYISGSPSGGVTSVSVISANGFAGSSSGGSTPALTLSTSVTGILKGNGTAISAATAGTDYQAPFSPFTTGQVLFGNGTSTPAQNTNLFWDNTNHRLGIGTATPGNVLSVNGGVSFNSTLNMNTTKIVSLATPTVASDASTKGYADGLLNNTTLTGNILLTGAASTAVTLADNVIYSRVASSNFLAEDTLQAMLALYVTQFLKTASYSYFNDFINPVSATSQGGDSLLALGNSTGTISAQPTDSADRVGLVRSSVSASGNRAGASSQASALRFGGGPWTSEYYINITNLSNATDRFQLLIGFQDTVGAINQVDAAYFLYDEGAISTGSAATGNWQLVTCSNSTRTFSTSSTAVVAATWIKLGINVDAAGTLVTFLINGTSVGTISTNIPTGSGRETGFGWLIAKSTGSTARTFDIDYLSMQSIFTTPR